ncbi:MAG: hypothetical protein ACLR1V_01800 [Coprococcus sp.]
MPRTPDGSFLHFRGCSLMREAGPKVAERRSEEQLLVEVVGSAEWQ